MQAIYNNFIHHFFHSSIKYNGADPRQDWRHENRAQRVLYREPTGGKRDSDGKEKPVQVSGGGCLWPTDTDDVEFLARILLRRRGEAVSRSAPSWLRLRLEWQGPDSRDAGGPRYSRSRSWRRWGFPFGWVRFPVTSTPFLCVLLCATGGSGSKGPAAHTMYCLLMPLFFIYL